MVKSIENMAAFSSWSHGNFGAYFGNGSIRLHRSPGHWQSYAQQVCEICSETEAAAWIFAGHGTISEGSRHYGILMPGALRRAHEPRPLEAKSKSELGRRNNLSPPAFRQWPVEGPSIRISVQRSSKYGDPHLVQQATAL
ncbi:hypothetical protein SCUP234_05904 [Seiridium cupressi]